MDRREAIKRTTLLFGVAASSSVISGILNGCTAEKEIGYTPTFLDQNEAKVINNLVDLILPKTSSPGGLDVGVDIFVDKMIGACYSVEEKSLVKRGLSSLIEVDFTGMSNEQQIELLNQFESQPDKFDSQNKNGGQSFFHNIKSLCLLGYFTSEEIMTKHLEYVPIPTRLEGCTPLKENQKLIVGNHI